MDTRAFALARNDIPVRFQVYEDLNSARFANIIASDGRSRSRISSNYSELDDTNARSHEVSHPNFFLIMYR